MRAQDLQPLPQLASQGVLDLTAEGLVRVEWSLPRTPIYPGQTARLALELTVDDAFRDQRMVQPFTRRLELPVAIDAPTVTGLELGPWSSADPASDGVTLAVGDQIVRAEWVGSRARIESAIRPTRAGSFALPAPLARFAAAEEFRNDVLGRIPVDPRLGLVRGAPAELVVQSFPEPGRSPDFEGALGRYVLRASLDSDTVQVGDTLVLRVEITGSETLDDAQLPRLDRWRGLHLSAQRVERTEDRVTVEAELRVERATVRAIPPVELHSFDPLTGAYSVASSVPIPLRVTGDARPTPREDLASRPPRWLLWVFGAALLGLVYLVRKRARAREASRARS